MVKQDTSRIMRKAYFTLRDFMLDRSLLPGHSDYVRFIILGRSRVGSTLLLRSLQENRQILGFGELFQANAYQWVSNAARFHNSAKVLNYQYHERPDLFLENQIFRQHPKGIKAVGFKIFYYHARNGSNRSVWDYLERQTDIRVIHIKRRNMLQTILSREKAAQTHSWIKTRKDSRLNMDTPQVDLDFLTCQSEFVQTESQEASTKESLRHHQMLNVYYEDLVGSFGSEMEKIQQFLSIEPQQLMPATLKQADQPLAKAIANYDELKYAFKGTKWASYFNE